MRQQLTAGHEAPLRAHKDLVITIAPAQTLIWHLSSVNQGGSFGGGCKEGIKQHNYAFVLKQIILHLKAVKYSSDDQEI